MDLLHIPQISPTLALTLMIVTTIVVKLLKAKKQSLPSYVEGPVPTSWLIGSQAELVHSEAGVANRRWRDQYGNVYRFQSCFGTEWLMLNDPNAIQHVLNGQTTTYHLEESLREFLRVVTGKGIIYADGHDHARQRRLVQPAFNTAFIKGLTNQFASCAYRVAQQWHGIINNTNGDSANLDVYHWMELVTMESIGQAAFGVRFNCIEGASHELMKAYQGFISTAYSQPSKLEIVLQALALKFPPWVLALLDKLPLKKMKTLKEAKASGLRFASDLIAAQRQKLALDPGAQDRDLLSVLARAGEPDGKGKLMPMKDVEIYDQLTTFFVAGYETAANTSSFCLYEIARDQEVQAKLYAEVQEVIGSLSEEDMTQGFDHAQLDAMPYLNAVIKETLRLHPTVAHGLFQAGQDDIIPLSKPIMTSEGLVSSVPVQAGQRVFCAFDGVNRLPDVWGSDANEFRPDRWSEKDKYGFQPTERTGGPYANLSNFGGGPKSCVGWRFAVIELACFVAVLVRDFELSIASPSFEMWRDGCFVVTAPTEKGKMNLGPRVPLHIRRRPL